MATPRRLDARYCLFVLVIAYISSFIDRAILTILVEPIQRDLGVNDTAIGLMHGFAFAIFYVTLGIPLGYLADRVNRKRLIVVCIVIWSVMTFACGLARSFGQLFAARIGVGVGEAGLSPASYSMITDYYPPEERSAALGIYQLGVYIGGGLAIILGGVVVDFVGHAGAISVPVLGEVRAWQMVFFIVGLPGLLVALLCTTLREPPRIYGGARPDPPSLKGFKTAFGEVLRHVKANPALFILHFVGFSSCGVATHVCLLWARPFLSREMGMAPSEAAYAVGLMLLTTATAGIILGSAAADRLAKRGHREGSIYVGIAIALATIVPALLLPLANSVVTALLCLGGMIFFASSPFGAAASALMLITPEKMRAQMSALYLLILNLIGLSLAPVLTGLLTDYVFQGPEGLSLSMATVAIVGAMLAATCLFLLLKPYRRAVANS